ncbi:shikimate dehydrogenase family protein [Cupriavidus basilensis]|uniref:shikimate dehydrogenase (NADP(+)) n=1 Tax=Cupriavidus basilensis TaxID=68895 RepID=A0A0C4Y8N8_9BURK|nr:shikimate dehydrogenase [Cupriavidus basilensis]AJG21792.1 Shikimate 5-dehydrogenase I alpha [Cupriavidus basilensis]
MQIDGNTQLVGIIAAPIAHVRTPQLFNASVARQGLNAVCVPFHVDAAQLQTFLAGAPAAQNLQGLVVTMPHKEAVVAICGELTDAARLLGSVNAMRFDRQKGFWVGGNFDGDGFVAGLRERGHSLSGKRVLQLGAGGAGKSMAYAMAREQPAELVIYNRSADKAEELAASLKAVLPTVSIRAGDNNPAGFDVVVNATALGLRDTDATPLPAEQLGAGTLVCEAVIRDGDTPLLKAARERGCAVHHGQWMLYGQIVEIARFLGVALAPEFVERILGPAD